ncbi:MAG: DUF3786 domain-containing protein [Lachnospiraceae bacterium]|jgi:hypothetical protein|nr:DUF3786 domain-containing protein [Lachnospiraceae bacterium]
MEERTSNNYVKVLEKWRRDFLTWDQEALCKKVGLDTWDEKTIRLSYFGIPHEIDRETGRITCVGNPEYELIFDEIMAIYNFLYYAKEGAKNAGEWIPLRDVKDAGVFEGAFEKQVLIPFAGHFAGRAEAFKAAGERLGFLPLSYGDGAFQVPAFFCIPLRVIFWEGDEEFPAKVNLLFDKNITSFIHPESVVMLGMECMRYFILADNPGAQP